MQYYDFEVLRGDDVIASELAVALDDSRAAWPKVVGIAETLDTPGCRIRVREQQGNTIILIGATAARRYPEAAAVKDAASTARPRPSLRSDPPALVSASSR